MHIVAKKTNAGNTLQIDVFLVTTFFVLNNTYEGIYMNITYIQPFVTITIGVEHLVILLLFGDLCYM